MAFSLLMLQLFHCTNGVTTASISNLATHHKKNHPAITWSLEAQASLITGCDLTPL